MRILYNQSDAAPVCYSEVYDQKVLHHPVELVSIPDKENINATYVAGRMKDALHLPATDDFMTFLVSNTAKEIYKKYGIATH